MLLDQGLAPLLDVSTQPRPCSRLRKTRPARLKSTVPLSRSVNPPGSLCVGRVFGPYAERLSTPPDDRVGLDNDENRWPPLPEPTQPWPPRTLPSHNNWRFSAAPSSDPDCADVTRRLRSLRPHSQAVARPNDGTLRGEEVVEERCRPDGGQFCPLSSIEHRSLRSGWLRCRCCDLL